MNRHEFLKKLNAGLKRIPSSERKDVINYYNEYLDDAGLENEVQAIAELAHPNKIAAQITAEYIGQDIDQITNNGTTKQMLKSIWFVVASVFALPFALPIVVAVFMVVFSLIFTVFMLLLSFIIVCGSFIITGIFMFLSGIVVIPMHLPTSMFLVGCGLTVTAIGIFSYFPLKYIVLLCTKTMSNIARAIMRTVKRRNGVNEANQYK